NHAVAADFEREMISRREHIRRHIDDVALRLYRLDGGTGGDPPHYRHRNWPTSVVLRACSYTAQIAFNHARSKPARTRRAQAMANRIWQLDYFDGAGSIGESPNEAALLKRCNQPVNAGFGA